MKKLLIVIAVSSSLLFTPSAFSHGNVNVTHSDANKKHHKHHKHQQKKIHKKKHHKQYKSSQHKHHLKQRSYHFDNGYKYVSHRERHDDRKHHHKHKDYRHHPAHREVVVVVPRKRVYHDIHVHRHYGHSYYGYGHYHNDNDAFKWLAFTAITMKLLDNLNEQAQRSHEAAQIKATTAPVGEAITWHTDSANGQVITTKEGKNQQGQTCREFQQTVIIGGKSENAFGTACLQADGSWQIVES